MSSGTYGPVVRIELEHMKEVVISQFSKHNKKLEGLVEEQIAIAVYEFDFENAVKKAATVVIDASIKNYFSYGKGADVIKSAVVEILDKMFKRGKGDA